MSPPLVIAATAASLSLLSRIGPSGFVTLAPGYEFASYTSPVPSIVGDGQIRVVRVDPRQYDVQLVAGGQTGAGTRTAKDWCRALGCIAAINPGMFEEDYVTSTSFLRVGDYVNNARIGGQKSMFLLDPVDAARGPIGMADLSVQDPDSVLANWRSAVQGIRMIDQSGHATWSEQPKMWSVACFGIDAEGRFVMIHARSAWTMHTFIGVVQGLGLDLVGLQYGEGGPEATLYSGVGAEHEWVGSYETGFNENDGNAQAWPIPNVIAVFPK